VGSCEHGNEPSNFIKDGEYLDCLSDCKVLKKDSAPWGWSVGWLSAILTRVIHGLSVSPSECWVSTFKQALPASF
jgi:hypothetical protein